jgi:hypothetical protein
MALSVRSRPMALELHDDCKALGRFTLRQGDTTIAQGHITKIQVRPGRAPDRRMCPCHQLAWHPVYIR